MLSKTKVVLVVFMLFGMFSCEKELINQENALEEVDVQVEGTDQRRGGEYRNNQLEFKKPNDQKINRIKKELKESIKDAGITHLHKEYGKIEWKEAFIEGEVDANLVVVPLIKTIE